MDIDSVQRPRQREEFSDFQHRDKCTLCCGARHAAYVFAGLSLIYFPINTLLYGRALFASVTSFLDYSLFVPLPFAAMTFTHQVLLSESLWSKNKKSVFECNAETLALNALGWMTAIGTGTFISRRILVNRSRIYRLLQWDYHRKTRDAANKYMFSAFGCCSLDLDWYNLLWALSVYSAMWSIAAIFLEKQQGAHYAMFYRGSSFSKHCSPRWREWREIRVREEKDSLHVVEKGRWGNIITGNVWNSRGVK